MSSALGGPDGLSVDSLKSNHFCTGVKRGREYVCGGDADENAISKAVDLLIEAIRRITYWRVWETWWIEEWVDEWLIARDRLEVQLRGRYSDDVVNDLLGMVDKFINYNEDFWRYWHEVSNEVKRLVDDLLNGRSEVIVWEGEKGVSVYREYITLEAHRTRNGIVVQLVLNELEGITIEAPDIFKKVMSEREYGKFVNEVLEVLKGGFEEADGTIEGGKAAMGTTQIWQVVVWALLYPGGNYVRVNVINVNEGGVTITWHLRTNHDPLKGKILNDTDKLSEKELLAFMLGAILGDGWADVIKLKINGRVYDEAVIKITMSSERLDAWKSLLDKLREMGFNWRPVPANDDAVDVRFYGSNAINLSRAMMAVLPPILRDLMDGLGFEKWNNLRRIAEMEVRWQRGEVQITIANIKFTVVVRKGTVVLEHKAKNDAEVDEVINALRAVYGVELQVNVYRSGEYRVVTIPMCAFERYEDIKSQVIEVLHRKLEKTKDEKKRQIITKHLKRLTPTKETATAKRPDQGIHPSQTQAT